MTIQDQYTSTFAKTQETWAAAVESLTDNLKSVFAEVGTPLTQIDPNTAIDQVFDFWEKSLVAQRDAAKQFVAATLAAGEKVRTQAETVAASIKEQTESVQQPATKRTAAKKA